LSLAFDVSFAAIGRWWTKLLQFASGVLCLQNKRISNHKTSCVPREAARHNVIRASPMMKSKLEELRKLGRHAALKHFKT
jgi:hypothetical protein